jgi:CRISPR-associated endonuclease/helicase Cas3
VSYRDHFNCLSGISEPHQWQCDLSAAEACESRLIRIPTGFGKTLGVLSAWAYHRIQLANERWPRRLVWCLPMRVLVEQTEREVRESLARLGLLWEQGEDHDGRVGVHLLMGGADCGEWHLYPEHCAVLIGTQDMLLSRALNRGYGAARGRWPMDFGQLNQDCLWIMDEVQLMDVGLATSGQLQSFRLDDQRANQALRPCHTWWMSATLQRAWLQLSPDTQPMASQLPQSSIALEGRKGALWEDVCKSMRVELAMDSTAIAQLVSHAHTEAGRGKDGPTLVVLNRVEDAVKVRSALAKDKALVNTELRLVHSRFRPRERVVWRDAFLNRPACTPGTDRIIVATQVIEAGVDISAAVLITQIAPWPSLVQRFGRAARWGGSAQVVVADFQPKDDKAAAPYTKEALDGARKALSHLTDVAPLHLEAFEDAHPELLPALYPYAPKHLLLRHEIEELFDTTPDLTGADVDISRFIRSGEERDLQVFWQDVPEHSTPDRKIKPAREALCAVPAYKACEWLCKDKSEHLRTEKHAWVWDYLDGAWRDAKRRDLYPGQTVLVAAECGGYDADTGWTPKSKEPVSPVPAAEAPPEQQADSAEDDESLSAFQWQTIAVHGGAVGQEVAEIASILHTERRNLFAMAGRWHDVGKVHEAFNNSIRRDSRGWPSRNDLAKAPPGAWLAPRQLYPDNNGQRRGGFRHELASTLALFAVLQRHKPDHPALLGPWSSLLEIARISADAKEPPSGQPPNALEQEVLALSAPDFDLLAYLICSHHGKVRFVWHASPADHAAADRVLRIRGIREGDVLPEVVLATASGEFVKLPSSRLRLDAAAVGLNPVTGRSWTERTLGLLKLHGPFALAYLEALLRAADQRASRKQIADPLLEADEAWRGLNVSSRLEQENHA